MKKPIFIKIFGGYLLIILVFTSLLLFFSISTIKNFYIDTLANDLENLAQALKTKIVTYLEENREEDLDAFVKSFRRNIQARITVVDQDGIVLADSDEDPKVMNNHKFRPEIAAAFRGKPGRSARFSNTVKANMLYVGIPVERDGRISEVIRVSLYVSDIDRLFSALRINIGKIVLILFIISLLATLILSRSLSKPIQRMKQASERIASGDFTTRVFLKNRDELRDLAESLNSMTERIRDLFDELSRQKEELSGVLSTIADGLLAVDKQGKILFNNEIFRSIFQIHNPEGKFYWEAIRDREFNAFIKRIQTEKNDLFIEIRRDDRYFLCRATFLSLREEIVVSLHDLTEPRRLEKMKKDFISNVSHELRTPLTAIKGFAETLDEGVNEKYRSYVSIIHRNTERLINVVKDLLLLSELEERGIELEIEKVDLNEMIENILKIFDQETKRKKINVEVHSDSDLPNIRGDPFKLEQMFINIIDNAVKYTEKGNITILLGKRDEYIFIKIKDTGIGIPKDNISRIFERFYVVDKSRSRNLGGTGLGLSIVKHIAILHGGRVEVDSLVGAGTTFTVVLPVKVPKSG
jgi:two-component system phosphate regulon sensor histidine kinase PhoR